MLTNVSNTEKAKKDGKAAEATPAGGLDDDDVWGDVDDVSTLVINQKIYSLWPKLRGCPTRCSRPRSRSWNRISGERRTISPT